MNRPTSASLVAVAHAFRLGATGEANDGLRGIIDELTTLLPALGPRAQAFLPPLSRVLAAQQRGDYAALADGLEHELAPLLD